MLKTVLRKVTGRLQKLTKGVRVCPGDSTPVGLDLNDTHQEMFTCDFQVLPYPSFVG